jgi:hypothetical protein
VEEELHSIINTAYIKLIDYANRNPNSEIAVVTHSLVFFESLAYDVLESHKDSPELKAKQEAIALTLRLTIIRLFGWDNFAVMMNNPKLKGFDILIENAPNIEDDIEFQQRLGAILND